MQGVVIYADVLIIVNLYINFIIISFCAGCAGFERKNARIFLASLLGSLYSLIIFLPELPPFLSLAAKAAVSSLMVLIAFRPRKMKIFLKGLLILFTSCAMFAGLMYLMFFFFAPKSGYAANGVVYFDISLTALVMLTIGCYLVLTSAARIYKKRSVKGYIYYLTFCINGLEGGCSALLDTGCSLTEPFSARPVIVVDRSAVSGELLRRLEELPSRLVVMNTAAGSAVLKAYRADSVTLRGGEAECQRQNIYIAFSQSSIMRTSHSAVFGMNIFDES